MKAWKLWMTVLSFVVIAGCRNRVNESPVKQIIGDDERQYAIGASDQDKIGTLKVDGTAVCTAYASYHSEITTAAHCYAPEVDLFRYSFESINGQLYRIQSLFEHRSEIDLVRFEVEGSFTSFFQEQDFAENNPARIVGFDGEQGKFFTSEVRSSGSRDGMIYHTLDTVPSTSGAPILQNGYVVGVHLGALPGIAQNVGLILRKRDTATLPPSYEKECRICDVVEVIDAGLGSDPIGLDPQEIAAREQREADRLASAWAGQAADRREREQREADRVARESSCRRC